jgi:hypothetical protein
MDWDAGEAYVDDSETESNMKSDSNAWIVFLPSEPHKLFLVFLAHNYDSNRSNFNYSIHKYYLYFYLYLATT